MSTTEAQGMFSLEPPAPVQKVEIESGAVVVSHKPVGLAKIKDETKDRLEAQIDKFIDEVMSAESNSEQMKNISSAVSGLGGEEIKKTSVISNRMLDKPVKTLNNSQLDDNSTIGKSLLELRQTVERLDPSRQSDWSEGILSWLPFGNKVKNYFQQYQSSQTQINAILESLYNGKDELMQDNASIEVDKANMWDLMGKLEQFIYITKKLDERVEGIIPQIEMNDPFKAKVVREEVLFYVRQRHQDLLTHMAVTVQGYLALDIIRRNNIELMKGVDRASTTTVSALRIAVTVAQALTNQKLVLDQIKSLNTVTESLIAGNARLLNQQATEINKQATESTIKVEVLQNAFKDIFQAMDAMDNYKHQALDNMKKTVDVLNETVSDAKKHLDKTRQEKIADVKEKLKDVADEDDGTVKLM